MSDFYERAQATAERLISSRGQKVTISRKQVVHSDPVDGVVDSGIVSSDVNAVVLPATGGKIAALDNRLSGDNLNQEQLRFLLVSGAELSFEPKYGDAVKIGCDDWLVRGATAVSPAGTPVLYKIAIAR